MATYPAVQKFYASAIKETEQTGYSLTFIGRRRYHPEIMSNRDIIPDPGASWVQQTRPLPIAR
jgi:DNA polymerase I-like protein with 3'-5' exonuclease and polymerase domains